MFPAWVNYRIGNEKQTKKLYYFSFLMPEFAILNVSADPINKNRFSEEAEYSMIQHFHSSNSMKLS